VRLTDPVDDEEFDRRPQRRRYEEPLPVKIRKQLLSIAESHLKRVEDEVHALAKAVSDNYDDLEVRNTFFDLALQIVIEQPFKIPFVAATVVVLNGLNRGEEAVGGKGGFLQKICSETEEKIKKGDWRDVKLFLRFLACLQGILEEEGVFVVLTELFERAVDLQTASSDDVSLRNRVRIRHFTNTSINRHSDWSL
jgi:nuclear cap-binding protein subunit 1